MISFTLCILVELCLYRQLILDEMTNVFTTSSTITSMRVFVESGMLILCSNSKLGGMKKQCRQDLTLFVAYMKVRLFLRQLYGTKDADFS
jgi:hypothetical protein